MSLQGSKVVHSLLAASQMSEGAEKDEQEQECFVRFGLALQKNKQSPQALQGFKLVHRLCVDDGGHNVSKHPLALTYSQYVKARGCLLTFCAPTCIAIGCLSCGACTGAHAAGLHLWAGKS